LQVQIINIVVRFQAKAVKKFGLQKNAANFLTAFA